MNTLKSIKTPVRKSARAGEGKLKKTDAQPLVLELSGEQRERIFRVAGLLHTSPGDFVRMMIFSSLDSECDWEEFSQCARAYLDTRPKGAAADGPIGTRLEDQAPGHFLRLVG